MIQIATLGGGCYWCLEAYFKLLKGVTDVTSGYSGGDFPNPTAEDVYRGETGHAEVVSIKFDSEVISFEEILKIFFVMHDPTTLNRQGNDVGEIYRSVIFYHDKSQQNTAQRIAETFAKKAWTEPVVTAIEEFNTFYPADENMQDYYAKNPSAGYCQVVISPKITKLRKEFSKYLNS